MAPKRKPSRAPATPTDVPPHLAPGSLVEISSDDPGFRGSWYMGTVVKRASARKSDNTFLVQYTTIFQDDAGTKPLKETINAADLRPPAPRERARKFRFGEEVDAYHNDGWWEGAITKELENGKFHVYFKRSKEQLEFGEDQLRLHREWMNGSWKPPLEEEMDEKVKEEVPEAKQLKSDKGKSKVSNDTIVENSSEKEVTEGKMVSEGPVTQKKEVPEVKELKSDKGKSKVSNDTIVENSSEKEVTEGKMVSEGAVTQKKEVPEVKELKFDKGKSKVSNDTIVEDSSEKEVTEGKMVSAEAVTQKKLKCDDVATEETLDSDKPGQGQNLESGKITDEKFSEGARVEVKSDEDGFKGAWFVGTIVKAMGNNRYLVEYESLRTEDDTDFLKEEFDVRNIRPPPPEIVVNDRFGLLDEVDALFKDGWWVGLISEVLPDSKYAVYFHDTMELLNFKHSQLRPHQDWDDGKWITFPKVFNL